jgi:acyl-CoA synthetase (AMP-forming)/AMP-acid ligase II
MMMTDAQTLGDIARIQAKNFPDKTALIFEDEPQSYSAFHRHTSQVANKLLQLGVNPNDRIAYLGKNTAAYFEILIGVSKAGGVTCPLNWRLSIPELTYILENSKSRLIFCSDEFYQNVQSIASQLTYPLTIVPLSDYPQWQGSGAAEDVIVPRTRQDDVLQLYTSGTTGRPKGVCMSNHSLLSTRARDLDPEGPEWNSWTASDVGLITMPVFHIGGTGFGLTVLYAGASGLIMPQFDAHAQLDIIVKYGVTKQFIVPSALQITLNDPRVHTMDFSKLKYIQYGASPIPIDLMKACMDVFGCGFVQKYGMTETCGTCVALPPEDHTVPENPRMKSVGLPLKGVELRIVNADGETVSVGETGEIVIRSTSNMSAYWNNPEATQAAFFDGGWLRTGDAGCVDADGYLYIQDRIKDMILSGGENIYSAEVEAALRENPDIIEVSVIGVPDDKWGEAVMAFVVLKPDASATSASIIEHCKGRIANFKCPKSVAFIETLPKNASGKVLKRELREPFWKELDRAVN